MADPLTLGLGLLGGLGGLFGGKRRPSPYAGQIRQATGNLSGLSSLLAGRAGQAGQYASQLRPQAFGATQQLASHLQTPLYNSQYSGARLADMTQGMDRDYRQRQSSLAAQLAARGIAPGQDSSALRGGLGAIEGDYLQGLTQARGGLYREQAMDERSRLTALQQLLSGAQDDYSQEEYQSTLGAAGIEGQLAQLLAGLQSADEARRAQSQQGLLSLLGQVAGTAGTIFGQGRASTPPYNPNARGPFA